MTRTVFDNAMTAHVWANQSTPEGKSNNGNFYFRGRRLYSYGSHFIVGLHVPGVGPVITADSYSISTAKHIGYAWRAVGYGRPSLPGLTDIADALESLGHAYASTGETARHARANAAGARRELEAYLDRYAAELSDESGAMLLRLMGSRGSWANRKARALAKAERRAETERKAAIAEARADAAAIARVPLAIVRARADAEAANYGTGPIDRMARDYHKAHKFAGGKRIRAAVWERLKIVRAVRKRKLETGNGRYVYGRERARGGLATLRRLQLGDYANAPESGRYPWGRDRACQLLAEASGDVLDSGAHMPGSIRAGLERQRRVAIAQRNRLVRRAEARRAAAEARRALGRTVRTLRDWRDKWNGTEESPTGASLRVHLETGPAVQRVRTLGSIMGTLDAFNASGRFRGVWARLEAEAVPAIAEALNRAEAALEAEREAERAARERFMGLSVEERRDAWRNGEPCPVSAHALESWETGPLLRANGATVDGCRVTGGELETSQGARVPLRHAFRVFQFCAAVRRAGKAWQPADAGASRNWGPARIRVGHFSVDRIDSTGDFVAGCHSIKWAEVERLAERLGVADCVADPETISGELETAAA